METVSLKRMTRELCHELYQGWCHDPSICIDASSFQPFHYDEASVDRYFDSKNDPSHRMFVILLGERPIGELQLKRIDPEKAECTLSIHMQNDTVKGKGFGTQAECMAVQYAFEEMGMAAVNADTVAGNTRSQHVLEKVGFAFVRTDGTFNYYRIER